MPGLGGLGRNLGRVALRSVCRQRRPHSLRSPLLLRRPFRWESERGARPGRVRGCRPDPLRPATGSSAPTPARGGPAGGLAATGQAECATLPRPVRLPRQLASGFRPAPSSPSHGASLRRGAKFWVPPRCLALTGPLRLMGGEKKKFQKFSVPGPAAGGRTATGRPSSKARQGRQASANARHAAPTAST